MISQKHSQRKTNCYQSNHTLIIKKYQQYMESINMIRIKINYTFEKLLSINLKKKLAYTQQYLVLIMTCFLLQRVVVLQTMIKCTVLVVKFWKSEVYPNLLVIFTVKFDFKSKYYKHKTIFYQYLGLYRLILFCQVVYSKGWQWKIDFLGYHIRNLSCAVEKYRNLLIQKQIM